jgi:hypothetical protein
MSDNKVSNTSLPPRSSKPWQPGVRIEPFCGCGVRGDQDGHGVEAAFDFPCHVTMDLSRRTMFLSDRDRVRQICVEKALVLTVVNASTGIILFFIVS